MRKRCKRRVLEVSVPLSDEQYTNLFTLPMMHLTALVTGQGVREHALSVAGLLNLGAALAYQRNNIVLLNQVSGSMGIMLDVLAGGEMIRPLSDFEEVALRLTVAEVTNYMRLVSKSALVKAMLFVEQELNNRRTVTGHSTETVKNHLQGNNNVEASAA